MRRQLSCFALASALIVTACQETPADIIVINDQNVFDNTAALDANNVQLYKNLVNFTTTGRRAQARKVLIHIGHSYGCATVAVCLGGTPLFETTIQNAGYTVVEGNDVTAPLTAIAADVKVIFLMVPNTNYSDAEVTSFEAFLADSGRVVFVGEGDVAWRGSGIAVMNDFLTKMESGMRNTGGAYDCASAPLHQVIPASSLRNHQVTTGLTQLLVACASQLQLSPGDHPLVYDRSGTRVLAAVTTVEVER